MFANNEIGTINDIKMIGEIAQKYNIPFHTDAVQIFGKYKINLPANNIHVLSASFHKLYGPQGVGLLIIHKDLISGYDLKPIIHGTQFSGMRGGTENVPGIAGSIEGMTFCFDQREKKNEKMQELKNFIIDHLRKKYKEGNIYNYINSRSENVLSLNNFEYVLLGDQKKCLPNTLSIAFCKNIDNPGIPKSAEKFCNVNLKKWLADEGIYLSISSACLTDSKKASHVLEAIDANPTIKCGMIRISMSDYTTKKNITDFLKVLDKLVAKQLQDMN
jgi:cysteine desulfurase